MPVKVACQLIVQSLGKMPVSVACQSIVLTEFCIGEWVLPQSWSEECCIICFRFTKLL